MSKIIDFYLKVSPNTDGLTIEKIWPFSDDELEHSHDVIQWLFPTIEASRFNPDTPCLTQVDIQLWKANLELKANFMETLNRFLSFLGLSYEEGKIVFRVRRKNVWCGLNHNWLRITRVLNRLSTLGFDKECKDLFECLAGMNESKDFEITDEVFQHWKNAARFQNY